MYVIGQRVAKKTLFIRQCIVECGRVIWTKEEHDLVLGRRQ